MAWFRSFTLGILALTFIPLGVMGAHDELPNFIVFFTDDQGYNKVRYFGFSLIETL